MPAEVDPPGWILKSWNCSFELSNVTTTFGKEDSDCLIPVSFNCLDSVYIFIVRFKNVLKRVAVIMKWLTQTHLISGSW